MSTFLIIDAKIKDKLKYQQYLDQVSVIVTKYMGRYHVRSENIKAFGSWNPERIIVIEFPTEKHVQDWLTSSEYRAIAALREEGAETKAILVDGYES